MLKGFEDITYNMTESEMKLVPLFIKGFSTKHGKANAVTNREIVEGLRGNGIIITESRVRKVINYVRNTNTVPGLVATSDGYYVTNDPQEVQQYIDSLDGRENEIRRIKEKFIDYKKTLNLIQDIK